MLDLDLLFRVEFRISLLLLDEVGRDDVPRCEHFDAALSRWRLVSTARGHGEVGKPATSLIGYLCGDCAKAKSAALISIP